MGTIKLTKLFIFITLSQLFLGTSCKKNENKSCGSTVRYAFEVSSAFSSEQEIYNIGDTIFLSSTIPKTLIDLLTSQQIDYTNSKGIKGSVGFTKLDTVIRNFVDANSNFTLLPIKGTFINSPIVPESGIVSTFSESSIYEFKLAIVPKVKGIYLITVTNLYSQGLTGKSCTDAGFNMTISNANKHFNLFQYALGYTADALFMKTGYCFRVQ